MSDKETSGKKFKREEAPAGFDTRVGREQGKGWLTKEAGAVVTGRLLGRFIMKGSTGDDGKFRAFYQIQLTGAHGVTKDGKVTPLNGTARDPDDRTENVEITFDDGDIINIGEHKALEDLSPYTRDGGTYDVHITYLGEEKIGNTRRTFWACKGPFLKTVKPATRSPGPEPSLVPTAEPIPF